MFAWPELRALDNRRTALDRDELVKILTDYQDARREVRGQHEITAATSDLTEQQKATSFGALVVSAKSLRDSLK